MTRRPIAAATPGLGAPAPTLVGAQLAGPDALGREARRLMEAPMPDISHAWPTGALVVDPAPIRAADPPAVRRMVRRGLPWIMGGAVVYLLAPSVLGVLSASDRLVEIDWYWLVALLVCQGAVLLLTWVLQRLLIDDGKSAPPNLALVGSSQLIGNAVSTAAPFGGAAGTAAQVRVLARRGVDPRRATSGIVAFALLQVASIGALALVGPVMVILGFSVPATLGRTALLGCGALALITVLLVVVLRTDRAADWLGFAAGVVLRRDPKRIVVMLRRERRHLRHAMSGRGRAPKVLGVALARSIADYFCLLTAVAAVSPTPSPAVGAPRLRRRRGAAHDPLDPRRSRPGRGRAHPVAGRRRHDPLRRGAGDARLPHGVAVDPAPLRNARRVVVAPPPLRGRMLRLIVSATRARRRRWRRGTARAGSPC